MLGLYALKPWFTRQLVPLRHWLVRHRITPNKITLTGVLLAGGAAACLAVLPAPIAAAPVTTLLILRLACANLDGSLARETGNQTRWGAVLNELGDRAADLLVVAALIAHVPVALGLGALLAASAPSWVSLAGGAAGAPRINGGPMGKTERCLLVALAALSGWYAAAAVAIVVGAVPTVVVRLARIWSFCRDHGQQAPQFLARPEPVRSRS